MSRERELIDKYNNLMEMYHKDYRNTFLYEEAHRTLFDLSFYERNNIDRIENPNLLDKTMVMGINNVDNKYEGSSNAFHIVPPTYQKLDNNMVMVIADLHYISKQVDFYKYHEDSINYVNAATKFALENKIKEIVILGDLVDGKYYNPSINGLVRIINSKSYDDLLNEVSNISGHLRKRLPGVKIRLVLGNHDMNAINYYKYKYGINNNGYNEYFSIYDDNDIKLDGAGSTIYSFGENKILFEHEIFKSAGVYNPFEVDYKYLNEHTPLYLYRSISGHSHYFSYRYFYRNNQNDISNVICPCLKGDIPSLKDSFNIEYPGFLMLYSVRDKILVDPYFINKTSDGLYDIKNLYELCDISNKIDGKDLPDKFRKYNRNKRLVLDKVIY